MGGLRRWLTLLGPWVALTNAVVWAVLWMAHATEGADRDWRHFHDTARLVLEGRAAEIYPGHTQGLPFLHPPYFVWVILPFGLLPRTGGFLASTAATICAMGAAMWFLRQVLPGALKRFGWAVLAVLGSASWTAMLALGQPSAWYLLFICATLFLWTRAQPFGAGLVISLMMLKPNLGAVFPLLFVVRGERRLLLGWLAGFAVLLLSTVPLGGVVWMGYLDGMRTVSGLIDRIPTWRQHTIAAFWRSLVHAPRLVTALWLGCAVPLAAVTGWAWLKADAHPSPGRTLQPRLLGTAVLLSVTCSPYLHHYDAIIVSLPAMVWYLDPDSYRSAPLRRVCGAALLAAYLIQQISLWGMQGGLSLVGPALAVWLVADALDLASAHVVGARRPTSSGPALSGSPSPLAHDDSGGYQR